MKETESGSVTVKNPLTGIKELLPPMENCLTDCRKWEAFDF
mgnify:CR=1 FL=1